MAKKRSKKELELASKIKQMEDAQRKPAPVKQDKIVSFNTWYHLRKKDIPKQHVKEIVWADMRARGVKELSTVEEFDRALGLYGVKL